MQLQDYINHLKLRKKHGGQNDSRQRMYTEEAAESSSRLALLRDSPVLPPPQKKRLCHIFQKAAAVSMRNHSFGAQ
jgi:hypothetical protein